MVGVIANSRTRKSSPILWTVPVLVHLRVWVHILGDPESVQLRNTTTLDKKKKLIMPHRVQGEGEEEEAIELTEEEEAIKTSLENSDTLSNEILDTIIPQWWNKEPFKLVLLDAWLLLAVLAWPVSLPVYTRRHAHTHACMHILSRTRTHTHTHTHTVYWVFLITYLYAHEYMHVCMHTCIHAHTHARMHAHTQASKQAHTHACTHTHSLTHSLIFFFGG